MARISISLPSDFSFSTIIPIRITDVNYGGHVGNDSILSIIHEARMQFLKHHGYSEVDFAGTGLIMIDVAINYKKELFYGDALKVSVAASDISRSTFDIVYKLETEKEGKVILIAEAKTGMVCFDYERRKMVAVPAEFLTKFLT
jgi:acyl-CoA thioester hydrolase